MKNNKTTAVEIMKVAFKVAFPAFLLMFFVGLLNCVFALAGIGLTEKLFSLIEQCYMNGTAVNELYYFIAAYGAYIFCAEAYSLFYKRYYVQFISLTAFEKRMRSKLHEKCQKISNEQFERPRIFTYTRQAQNATQHIYRFAEVVISIILAIINTVLITLYVSTFNVWYCIFIVVAMISPLAQIISQMKFWKRNYEETSKLQREEDEYSKALTSEKSLKETRLLGAEPFIIEKWQNSRDKRDKIENKKSATLFWLKNILSIIKPVGENGGLIVSTVLLMTGNIDLGAFAAGITAFQMLKNSYKEMFSMFGYYAQIGRVVQPFFRFWKLKERPVVSKESYAFNDEIEIKNVSFRYENSNNNAVDNLSLKIKKGEILALVGENGAGKTTLVNLILGLYRPASGNILYDGNDISEVSEKDLYLDKSAVFQKFNRYNFTVGENITVGDYKKNCSEYIGENIKNIFKDDAQINPDTALGKEYGGRELSGGQWQMLACARGFYKDADIYALDEPTSSIDPLREANMYKEFAEKLNGKTGIIITHRLGSIRLADKIVVLDKGSLVEYGTHNELMALDKKYAKMWRAQADNYLMNKEDFKI